MLIDIQYAIDDIVEFIHSGSSTTKCTCGFCGGSGEIVGLDGSKDECPRCEGKGFTEYLSKCDLTYVEPIKDIRVQWREGIEPEVFYQPQGWSWSQTWIPQKDVVGKVGEQFYPMCDAALKTRP